MHKTGSFEINIINSNVITTILLSSIKEIASLAKSDKNALVT